MKACLMDWQCECGAEGTNVPLIGLTESDVPGMAICSHEAHFPCAMILGKERCAHAVRQFDHWHVKLKTPEPSKPNPKRKRAEVKAGRIGPWERAE